MVASVPAHIRRYPHMYVLRIAHVGERHKPNTKHNRAIRSTPCRIAAANRSPPQSMVRIGLSLDPPDDASAEPTLGCRPRRRRSMSCAIWARRNVAPSVGALPGIPCANGPEDLPMHLRGFAQIDRAPHCLAPPVIHGRRYGLHQRRQNRIARSLRDDRWKSTS